MKEIRESEALPWVMEQIPKGAFLTVQAGKEKNVMTIGWALFGFVWRRSTMMVAVRNTRFTHGIIEKVDSFSVSVPTGSLESEIALCGSKSGKNFDKFKECKFATVPGPKSQAPILHIPGYHYECRIIYKAPMDPKFLAPELGSIYPQKDFHTLYFGEILGCYLQK
jgi:flavin reductase (DIM6/NTAB) family NADH-FMN oxidoreductase RutF